MKSFKCYKLNTEDINTVLLELKKAFEVQKKRNSAALASMEDQYSLLKEIDGKFNSRIVSLTYYKTYFEEICEANDL